MNINILEESLREKITGFLNSETKNKRSNIIKECLNHIQKNQFFINNDVKISIVFKDGVQAHYNPNVKKIFVPTKENENLEIIKGFLNESAFAFLIYHEIGHAVQHSSIGNQDSRFEPVKFDKSSELNYLFNGSSVADPINIFLNKNYQEIYADCYSGYCLYKQYNDINVFEKIKQFRVDQKIKFNIENPNVYHEYFDTYGLQFFKKEILNTTQVISYENIHDLINKSIIKGLTKTLVEELEKNDSILKALIDFSIDLDKKTPIKAFFNRLYSGSQNYDAMTVSELNNILNSPLLNRSLPINVEKFSCVASGYIFNMSMNFTKIIEIRNNYKKDAKKSVFIK